MQRKDWMSSDHRIAEHLNGQASRRTLLKRSAALGLGAPIVSILVAACADTDDDVDDPDDAAEAEDEEDDEPEDEPDEPDEEADEDDEPAEPTAGGTARVVMPQLVSDPTTMNPLFTASSGEGGAVMLHFGVLVKNNAAAELVPDLADNYEISEDAVEVTFHILEDANWSDGEPVSASDVEFTLERAVHPDVGADQSMPFEVLGADEYFDGEADSIAGISSPDEKTVVIELSEPNAIWLRLYTGIIGQSILPRHIYETIEPAELEGHELSRNPEVGAGPFLFSRWETEQFLEFTANENYVHGEPELDSIVMMLLEPSVALAQLEAGELDLSEVEFVERERAEGLEGVVLEETESVLMARMQVNCGKPYLTVPVRQAMMYAIDHEALVNSAYDGLATPVYSTFFADWMGDVVADAELNTYEYDPERAQELLEQEGWDPDQTVELLYPSDHADHLPAWTMIQSYLRDVGINLELREAEWPTVRQLREDGEYDMHTGWGGIAGAEPAQLMDWFNPEPDGSENLLRYNNSELNELIAEGTATSEQEARREVYLRAAQILNEECPWVWLFSPYNMFVRSERLEGFEVPGHFSNIFWNADQWSVSS